LCLTGNSLGQPPSGISGTGPFVGPPALNRSLGGSGLGDADALLGGDASVVGGGGLGGRLLVGGGVLGGRLLVGGGEVLARGEWGNGRFGNPPFSAKVSLR
jgi:hypothetical protein